MNAASASASEAADKLGRQAPWILGGLAGVALLLVLLARLTGYTATTPISAQVVDSRDVRFEDGAAGSVLIYDWEDGHLLNTYASGDGSFVRGVLRAMTSEHEQLEPRKRSGFRLARHSDGALTIEDLATGRQIVLNAFGPTNAANFAALLDADRES